MPNFTCPSCKKVLKLNDGVMFAQGEDGDFGFAVLKSKAPDLDAFRRKAKYGPATRVPFDIYKDKVVYNSHTDRSLMYLPNPKLVTVQPSLFRGPDLTMNGMLDNVQNSLPPEIESRIRSLDGNGMWFVMTPESNYAKNFKQQVLGGKLEGPPGLRPPEFKDFKPVDPNDSPEKKDDDFKSARIALKSTKVITLAANPTADNKGLKAEMTLECDKDEDAQKLEKALTSKKDALADFIAKNCPLNANDKVRTELMKDLKAMEIKQSGAKITITATIGEGTWDALKTWQEEREKAEKDEE